MRRTKPTGFTLDGADLHELAQAIMSRKASIRARFEGSSMPEGLAESIERLLDLQSVLYVARECDSTVTVTLRGEFGDTARMLDVYLP